MTETRPPQDPAELTRYIETRFHSLYREQFLVLAQLDERAETVHFGDNDMPEGLSDLLERMISEMEVHMKKEELILFPAINNGGRAANECPITRMRAYDGDHVTQITEIRRPTGNLTLPEGACETWAALYTGLVEFLGDSEEHMCLENDVLFPQFEPA